MDSISRRNMLKLTAGLGSGMFICSAVTNGAVPTGNLDDPTNSLSTLGPRNPSIDAENLDSSVPPTTDHGDIAGFKYSFGVAHKKVSNGGWARQITIKDLPISKSIAGVDMRLVQNAVRELHWHQAGEWSFMLAGQARITAIDPEGKSFVKDLNEGDLWFFPTGIPHSIQGIGSKGCEFLLVFDDGGFSEFDTFLLSDWIIHTPKEILSKNFGLPESAFNNLPKEELYIFPGPKSGPFAADQKSAAAAFGMSNLDFSYSLTSQKPNIQTKGGEVRIVDSKVFPVSTSIAAALVTVHPGGMREMHWHPNADEWQYYIKGKGRMTLFAGSGNARTMDFQAGDVGYVPITMGHYIENTGDTDLQFLEMFKSSYFQDISLLEWLKSTPPELVTAHIGLTKADLDSLPNVKVAVVPEK